MFIHSSLGASMAVLFRSVALVLVAVTPCASEAQDRLPIPTLADTTQPVIQVMILGVFHFHNPNADYAKFAGIDVLTPKRQREIQQVADQLARFGPTKIAVERTVAEAESLNADYRRYREGAFTLSRNEVHQLGFRLADQLGQEAIYPVDFRKGMRIDSVMAYARAHEPETANGFDQYIREIVALFDRMQREETIGDNLIFMNEPANVIRTHEPYAVQAAVGAGDGYIGARVVADWYERNLHIFANLVRIATPGDRILFIVGAGHTPILRHLVEAHPAMTVVEAVEYQRN